MLETQQRELPLQAEAVQGETERNLAALAQASTENEARQRIVIRAPPEGGVTNVLAGPGQSVQAGVAMTQTAAVKQNKMKRFMEYLR